MAVFRSIPWPYGALVLLSIGLIWTLPYFPTQDGPSHLYNLVILHDLLNGGRVWGEYFTHDLRATPNLGFHLVAYPLLAFFSPRIVEKLFVSLYILLMTVSVPCFLRTFGNRPFPLSYLVFPLLFNYALMMGFYSFSLAVPCMLLSISLAWSLREGPLLQRTLVFNLSGFFLFYLHLIPFSLYMLFLFIMTLACPQGFGKRCRDLLIMIAITLPCLINALHFLVGTNTAHGAPFPYTVSISRFGGLLAELLVFSLDTFAVWQLAPWVGLAVMIYAMLRTPLTHQPDIEKIRDARRCIMMTMLAVTMIYSMAPNDFAGGSLFNQRLPWVILLLLLPLLTVPVTGFIARFQGVLFPGMALLFLSVNGFILHGESLRVEEYLAGMKAEIPKGSWVVSYKFPNSSWSRIDPLLHVASYYGMGKGCVDAGNYEAVAPHFPVRFSSGTPQRPLSDQIEIYPSLIDWGKYPAIGYILGWEVTDEGRKKLEEHFRLVMKNKRFTLWQRK
jgi:hypothetical protein